MFDGFAHVVAHFTGTEEQPPVVDKHLGQVVDDSSEVVEGFSPVVEVFCHVKGIVKSEDTFTDAENCSPPGL